MNLQMGIEAWITIGIVLLALCGLAFTRFSADMILAGAMVVLLTLGIINPEQALVGFANEGVITVGVLFVVAAGLRETGVLTRISTNLLGNPRTVTEAQARLMIPTSFFSALMNNTPLVATLVPVIDDWCKKIRISPSKLLIPLSYAAILGGLCTLLGTSTNLIVAGLYGSSIERGEIAGEPLGMFSISWIGIPCAIAGLGFLLLFSRFLLPDRKPAFSQYDDPKQYTVEMVVEAGSPLVGKSIEEAGLRQLDAMYLMEIERDRQVLTVVSPNEVLRENDRLVFVGVVDSVIELQQIAGLRPATRQTFKLDSDPRIRILVEAVVSNTCSLLGQSIKQGRFRTMYNAVVIAASRNGDRIRKKMGNIILRPGDTLLLEADPSFVENHRNSRDFYLISQVENATRMRHNRRWFSILILAGMVASAATGLLNLVTAALLAGGLMIATKCCSATVARKSVDWQLLIAIGSAFALGRAMDQSGAADGISGGLLSLVAGNPWLSLVVIYLVTMLFTELITNNAAAVLMFPIGITTAQSLDSSPLPFVFAIMIAASCGFATPLGYQTNLMVYGPGGYRFSDYIRCGGMLNLLIAVIALALIPVIWPFS